LLKRNGWVTLPPKKARVLVLKKKFRREWIGFTFKKLNIFKMHINIFIMMILKIHINYIYKKII